VEKMARVYFEEFAASFFMDEFGAAGDADLSRKSYVVAYRSLHILTAARG
jgi:hypothetical protein